MGRRIAVPASRVVVTGLGTLTAAGTCRSHLLRGTVPTCFRPRSFAPHPGLPEIDGVCAASLPELPVRELLPARGVRALSDEGRAALCAAVLACREARIELRAEPAQAAEVGVALGTTRAGLDEYVRLFSEGVALGPDGVMPARGPRTGYNTPASELSIVLAAGGPNLTVSSGAASAGDAIAAAADLVREGRASAMLAGGVDLLSYMAVRAERGIDPGFGTVADPRPFDRDRRGGSPGEAAVVLVVEDAARAARREATCLAELAGMGTAFAPGAAVSGSADAARRAVAEALACAGVGASEVDAVIASACGSPERDATEASALVSALGDRVPVCSAAGAVGDCGGAAAAVQVALAVAALEG
ncbi:MAG TPA: beta-ketoacyl synthase N-terminal-like domain-containing protein, partial [Candidatus Eisenbacteria bacterium]|nr:beta-ketoacyl synthase N-terminal-like domain-containing protein [Candidatus Eisenbacteria bacterium]